MVTFSRLGLSWTPFPASGWGVYGWQICRHVLARGQVMPELLGDPLDGHAFTPADLAQLSDLARAQQRRQMVGDAGGVLAYPMLHALLNDFVALPASARYAGRPEIGVIFLENADLDAQARARAARYDLVLAGCGWNEAVLRAAGIDRVATQIQGVDTTRFHPGPRRGDFGDRFCIFGGGKLEYRKGQDIVVAAFRRFAARHPEALLVTAWHNLWPQSAADLTASPHVDGPPAVDGATGRLRIAAWATANGIPAPQFLDLGLRHHDELPAVLREMDLAVFPSRCEGGTNLAAMEAMACGVPTILSANTGHLDLTRPGVCYRLARQGRVGGDGRGHSDWGESDVEELDALFEAAYHDREAAREIGSEGAAMMADLSWPRQIDQLLERIDPLVS